MIKHILDTYLDGLAPAIPLLFLVLRYKYYDFNGKLFIVLFFAICFFGFLTADYIGDKGGNNLFLYNVIPLCLTIDLFFFFRKIHTEVIRIVSLILTSAIFVSYVFTFEYKFPHQSFSSIYYIMFSIFVLVNAMGFYYKEFISIDQVAIWKKTEFWFITCILFYSSISIVIWGFFKILMDKALSLKLSEDEMRYIGDLWKLHNLVFAVSCICFFVSLVWKKSRVIS